MEHYAAPQHGPEAGNTVTQHTGTHLPRILEGRVNIPLSRVVRFVFFHRVSHFTNLSLVFDRTSEPWFDAKALSNEEM